jgi:N-acetylglucosamine-6-phosphate deacetylase
MKCTGVDAVSGEHVEIEFGDLIEHVNPVLGAPQRADFIAPGFIDLQINGFAGADFNSPSEPPEHIAIAIRAAFSTGVTRLFPTIITGPPEDMLGALRNLARAREVLEYGPAMEAFHVEGPHISPEDGPRGAHPKQWVRPPDFDEFRRWQDAAGGRVRIVTVAPEWPGSTRYIEQITGEGAIAAIGHTRATPEQIRDAVAAGATLSTHLGNGAGSKDRRDPFIAEQLAQDRLAASFIVDRHHLPDEFLRRALEAKGIERSVLITDAVAPAMFSPGRYTLGGAELELHQDGRVTLAGGVRLAGSSLRMDHAVANVIERAGATLRQAIVMATTNPARVGRVPGRLRGIRPGERADFVRFRYSDGRIEVVETWFSGRKVYGGR